MNNKIDYLKDELFQVAGQFGMSSDIVPDFVRAVIDRLAVLHGGGKMYIPARDKKHRDAAILQMFNGSNRNQVCKKFGISKSTFYRIIKR